MCIYLKTGGSIDMSLVHWSPSLDFFFVLIHAPSQCNVVLSLSLSRRTPSQCNFFQFALAWHLHMPIFATTDDLECREYHTSIMHLCACSLYTKVAAHKNHLLLFSCRD